MTVKEALQMIVDDCNCPALNYAVNYAKAGLLMDDDSEELRVQCLYVQGNISSWRAGSTSKFTKEQIKECRDTIKKGGKR